MGKHEFQILYKIPATPEKVFSAWTDQKLAREWYCWDGFEPGQVELDVRVGGRFHCNMSHAEESFTVTGEYTEVVPNEKLSFNMLWEDPLNQRTQVTVEFRKKGRETEILLSQENFMSEDGADSQRTGWLKAFDTLAKKISGGQI